ncbi:unnamed protein product, partial [Iphiclides podalirius]
MPKAAEIHCCLVNAMDLHIYYTPSGHTLTLRSITNGIWTEQFKKQPSTSGTSQFGIEPKSIVLPIGHG